MADSYPYLAKSILRYKSPHKTDLSFDKGETIRVTGPSPDDEEWLVGESLDGARTGGFPKEFVEVIEDQSAPTGEDEAPAHPPMTSAIAAQPPVQPEESEGEALAAITKEEPSVEEAPKSIASPPPAVTSPPAPAPAAPVIATSTPAARPAAPAAATATTSEEDPAKLSFKDRLAAFNRPGGAGPPPPVKPKPAGAGAPGTWSWKQKQAQAQAHPQGGDAAVISTETTTAAPTPAALSEPPKPAAAGNPDEQGKGMSASDAQSSISKGGSLKDRMAALQGAGAFGSPAAKGPPPPVAAKPKVWKRPEVPAGSEEAAGMPMMGMPPPPARALSGDGSAAGEEGETAAAAAPEGEVPAEDQDEEQKEKERRAAIAARMAKLGGRGVMGGGIMGAARPAAAAPPVKSPSQEVDEPVASDTAASAPVDTPAPVDPISAQPPADDGALSPPQQDATSPPTSIKLPSVPRRTGAPKRKTPARGASQASNVSATAPADSPADIPFVGNETEEPIPETEEQKAQRQQLEEAGRGANAAAGASAAGMALEPTASAEPKTEAQDESGNEIPIQRLNIEHSGAAEQEDPAIAANAPLDHEPEVSFNPAEEEIAGTDQAQPMEVDRDEAEGSDAEDAPPPPPARSTAPAVSGAALLGLPKDEVEMKHEADEAEEAEEDNDQEDQDEEAPPPPPRVQSAAAGLAPPIPSGLGKPISSDDPQRDGAPDEEDRPLQESEDPEEEDDLPPPPPPVRPGQSPPPPPGSVADEPTQTRLGGPGKPQGPRPMPASPSRDLPTTAAVASKPDSAPAVAGAQASAPAADNEAAPRDEVDEEAERRKGIAARMAKLGGIKFGQAPPVRRPTADSVREPEAEPTSPINEGSVGNDSKIVPVVAAANEPEDAAAADVDEDPDAAAKRRQATLARLRAGGALGFGMFNHQQPTDEPDELNEEQPAADQRGLEQHAPQHTAGGPQEETRGKPEEGTVEAAGAPDVDEHEDVPPPPPPTRAPPSRLSLDTGSRTLPSVPEGEAQQLDNEATRSPIQATQAAVPGSPSSLSRQGSRASTTQGRPESPAVRRRSSLREAAPLGSPTAGGHEDPLMEESAVMMMHQNEGGLDESAPPPPPRSALPRSPSTGQSLQRGASIRSASSRDDVPSPAARTSMSQNRPAFTELKEASATYGSRVYQAASRLADQGKKQTLGDGDARALVWQAMTAAGLDANVSFGTLILEQNGPSVVRRMDEPRAGDVVVLADVKLKGKKGLQSYTQAAGSVEIPVFGVCTEFESKKTKVKVWQVEQGHVESASYRLDDLKSGNVKVFRPMP